MRTWHLVRSARAVAKGDGERRVGVSTDDEVGGIAGSLSRMAEELEQTMSQLARERGRLRAVLEGMGEAVVALNARSRIELVNRSAMELLGINESAIGDTLLETVPVEELKVLTAAAHGGDTVEAEFELPGRARRVYATATPQPGGAGCVIVLHDVTELRRLERVRRDFVANVSHELRTPVSVIRANAETLTNGGLSDATAAQSMCQAIVRHSTRLSDILADLLEQSICSKTAGGLPSRWTDKVRESCALTDEKT